MNFLPDEKILIEAFNKTVILSTHRIRQKRTVSGKESFTSIMLENITSCELTKKSKPMYLLVFVVFLFLALISGLISNKVGPEITLLSGVVAGIFLILFFSSLKRALYVSSPTAEVILNISGMKDEKVISFIDKLENAKNARYLKITLDNNHQNLQVNEIDENEDDEDDEE